MYIMDRIHKIKDIVEELTNPNDLQYLLTSNKDVICYDGFEPSGRMHIAQGLIRAMNTNVLTKMGFHFKFWVADWFAMLNGKLGGDLKKIRKTGELMIEIWKLCGMKMDNVEFIWSSEEINKNPDKYWSLVMDIACKNSLNRIIRCGKIMGRKDNEKDSEKNIVPNDMTAAQIFYPCMQCADIFYLNVDICSLGMDQRKVNMLALEYCDKIKKKHKPVILSHFMLMGLDGSDKMSKSNPDNAIFMDDLPHEVKRKINKAYCPIGISSKNPIIQYYRHIIFKHPSIGDVIIKRKDINGGNVVYDDFYTFKDDYDLGNLHPKDLKDNLVVYLNNLLEPIQTALQTDNKLKQLAKIVKGYQK
jgi:tyrosyl-tRNA synthetase